MKATADCAFEAGVAPTSYHSWNEKDPKGACSFHLESPVSKAADAERFAAAFSAMMLAAPKPDGVTIYQKSASPTGVSK